MRRGRGPAPRQQRSAVAAGVRRAPWHARAVARSCQRGGTRARAEGARACVAEYRIQNRFF